METEEDSIFNNDPIYMKSLIGKKIKIKTVEETYQEGIVYVIDPIFKTVVLFCKLVNGNGREYSLFPHHAIESLEILSNDVNLSGFPTNEESLENCVEKKEKLKRWLRHMFINFAESGDNIKIDDHLVIVPPYGIDNCICNNMIVLDKIQKIISLMPSEFS
ncbi:unnamed protein product [Brassicogethes aeneus]|uniref:AD domain-containing protein n=1 Tax=Brassicogethes aeneus TaxID=1431903 RepID=A0A9P0B8R8_BRAAE|nr:unnamed protein product [Brassicogethes aeneus]